MNAKEVQRKIITARLEGRRISFLEIHREDLIESAIKEARPAWPLGWLNVCPLNRVAVAVGAPDYRQTDAFKLLDAYHCVNYYSIPREIRRRIPELIREALKGGSNG